MTATPPRKLNRYKTFEAPYLSVAIPLFFGYMQWVQEKQLIAAMLWIFAASYFYVLEQGTLDPPNSAHEHFVCSSKGNISRKQQHTTLVCLGDSITHGRCSSNWVSQHLPKRLSRHDETLSSKLDIVNNGQNSITTYTTLQERVDWTLACEPDYCVILIGTNDARALVDSAWHALAKWSWRLPNPITATTIEANIRGIVEKLLNANTTIQIAICTIPPLGENLTTYWNRAAVEQVNNIIRKVVVEENNDRITLLDLNGALIEKIQQSSRPSSFLSSADMFVAHVLWQAVARHVFGLSWNTISSLLGNVVMTDAVHLNDTGGEMLSDLVANWLVIASLPSGGKGEESNVVY